MRLTLKLTAEAEALEPEYPGGEYAQLFLIGIPDDGSDKETLDSGILHPYDSDAYSFFTLAE